MIRRVALGTVGILLIATPCYAHPLNSVFWWLGPFAPMMAIVSVIGCLPLAMILVGQASLLHRFIPGMTIVGSLWRAAVIFVLSKVAETVPAFINSNVFFGPCSDAEFALIVVLMVVAAVVANVLLIGLLYWRRRPGMQRTVWLSFALECVSLGGLYITTTALTWAGIVR